jgi:hypothetical protein
MTSAGGKVTATILQAGGRMTASTDDTISASRDGRVRLGNCDRVVTGGLAVDLSFQNGRRLEHHHATWRNRNLDAGLGITAHWKLASG